MEEVLLSRWKLFDKSKSKKEKKNKEIEITVRKSDDFSKPEPEYEAINDANEETEDAPVKEYTETFYSSDGESKKSVTPPKTIEKQWKQRSWESADTIGENVDNLGKKTVGGAAGSWDINRKVDRIISDVDIKRPAKHRKPANVIYVVSKPQPGQVKGDWAVRSHSKIFSHHRKKQSAINAARKVAKEKGATVLVQNTDGTFSDGFRPR
jgi:hypothetical protein